MEIVEWTFFFKQDIESKLGLTAAQAAKFWQMLTHNRSSRPSLPILAGPSVTVTPPPGAGPVPTPYPNIADLATTSPSDRTNLLEHTVEIVRCVVSQPHSAEQANSLWSALKGSLASYPGGGGKLSRDVMLVLDRRCGG